MATNTAASFTNHTGNGTAGPFNISFSYLAEAEVDVTVGGVLKTITTHYTFTSATQITFTSGNEPANGVAIKFQRDTNISAKKVDFADGSVLTEADLDANSDQVLFAQQEIIDKLGGIEEGATGDQTAAEIRTLVESASDSNVFTDNDHTKLNNIEANATQDQTASEIKTLIASSPLDASHLAANSVNTSELADDSVTFAKIENVTQNRILGRTSSGTGSVDALTASDIRSMINVEDGATADQTNAEIKTAYEANSNTNVFTDAEKTKLTSVETNAKDDQTASEIKTLYESNSNTNALTDAEKTVIDGVTANTSELNKLDGFTGSTADLNQVSGMSKQTTITNSNSHFPTSGAVVNFVADQIAPVGGLEVIADEDNFPTTQPVSGVVISISNADGLVINSSGVATNARTVGNGSDNVTINNFPTSLRNKTLSNELGLLVSSTGASQIYNYHKLLAKETDVLQLSEDINDFGNRYRVVSTNPTSDNDAGDLIFNTSTQKLLVYNATSGAFEEAQSVGNFFISTLSPAFNGSVQDFTITNAPSNAQQIILSINGVIQKPNAGSSTPSEGFALSGSTVKLAAAPASGSDYFAIVLGSTVNIGTPSNNTVTSAMIVDGSIVNGDISNSADIAGSKLSLVSTSSTAGIIVKGDGSSDGYLQLNCSQNSHGIKLKSPPHSAGASYTFTFPQNIQNGQFLTTDANGNTSWSAIDLTALSASNLTSGTVPDARFPATLPAISGANLTNLDASDLASGTIPDARFPATLPAVNGANLTGINTDLVSDTTPQLGGNLDVNAKNIQFGDSGSSNDDRLQFGASTDLQIYHDSNNSYIQESGQGALYIDASQIYLTKFANSETMAKFFGDGAVELYHNNSKKFETTSIGFDAGDLKFRDTSSTDKMLTIGNTDTTTARWSSTRQGIKIAGTNPVIYGHTTTDSKAAYVGLSNGQVYFGATENGQILFQTAGSGTSTINRWYVQAAGHIIPASNDTYDLGSSSNRVRNIYTNDLNLSNEGSSNDVDGTWGSYTIQEGHHDLFLINKRNGKKYKFNLTEVS